MMIKIKPKSFPSDANANYRSGAAARLSGVPVETLRVWERRYGVTDPTRSERGQRQYSFEDVRRLGLIKQLVDAGNSIGVVAHLNLNQLLTILGATANLPAVQSQVQLSQGLLRVALVGVKLRQSLNNLNHERSKIDLIQTSTDLKHAGLQLKDVVVDVMLVEQGELTAPDEQIPLIKLAQQACQAKAVLILYRFASRDNVRQLRLAGFQVARMPADIEEIDPLCRMALTSALSLADQQTHNKRNDQTKNSSFKAQRGKKRQATIPERLLDDDNLMIIARSATNIHCECPRHLVDLLQMLTSFERYSAQCENRTEEDAQLHRDLHYTAAHARATLEQALVRVTQAEGIQYTHRK